MGIKHIVICSESRIKVLIGFHQEYKVINRLWVCLTDTYLLGEGSDRVRGLDKRFFMSYLCNKQPEVYSVRLRAILCFTMGNLSFEPG